ncbi:MAG: hypothetical protein L0Z62_06750 [Gemmataceae bacterium]|nr:hypothetical protein [Gemmataceae bacterium]
MRRLAASLLLPVALAAGLALADGPNVPTAAERVRRFQRDRALVERLVEGGLRLAGESDTLKRADECGRLARSVAEEIARAVTAKEQPRADRLGQHLEALLVRGVAANLSLASASLPLDSPRRPEVRQVGDRALAVMLPLEKELQQVPSPQQAQALRQSLTRGRTELEQAVREPTSKGKGKGKLKAPPAGKKLKAPK